MFHELATKYGASGREYGCVAVNWWADEDRVQMGWSETGACELHSPETTGFGTKLVETTIERIGGQIDRDWRPDGSASGSRYR